MTSAMIRVALTLSIEKNPTEDETESMTRLIANNPRTTFEPMNNLRGKRGKKLGVLRESIDIVDDAEELKIFGKFLAHLAREEKMLSSSRPANPLPNVSDT